MDIARYIGLFLLKNNFCYIHGLGNLTLKKRPATQDGEMLKGPEYEVLLTPTGSIDDNLANFIAVNEQISIAKAANALRDFSIHARAELQEGREVIMPALGRFIQKENKILFVTDPHFQYTPKPIPTVRIAKKTEEEKHAPSKASQGGSPSVNKGKIVIWILILGIVIAGIIFGIQFISEQTTTPAEPEQIILPEPEPEIPYTTQDTNLLPTDTLIESQTENPETIVATGNMLSYEVVINEYDNIARAQKREKQMTGFGNKVLVRSKDSSTHYVVMPMHTPAADTTRILDSLRKLFNPQGVHIYR